MDNRPHEKLKKTFPLVFSNITEYVVPVDSGIHGVIMALGQFLTTIVKRMNEYHGRLNYSISVRSIKQDEDFLAIRWDSDYDRSLHPFVVKQEMDAVAGSNAEADAVIRFVTDYVSNFMQRNR